MDIASVCLVIYAVSESTAATLRISPNRSQFFRYESFTLDCAAPDTWSDWTVMRNASKAMVPCGEDWGRWNGSSCNNQNIYASDSGQYWCQSEQGECSNVLNITVHNGVVILESPALAVMKGSQVALGCSYKDRYAETASSDFPAAFFKDGAFIGNHSGKLIFSQVKKANEGQYKCQHPTKGESPESKLTVVEVNDENLIQPNPTDPPEPPQITPTKLLCSILLFILYTIILILCIYTMKKLAKARAEAKRRPAGV